MDMSFSKWLNEGKSLSQIEIGSKIIFGPDIRSEYYPVYDGKLAWNTPEPESNTGTIVYIGDIDVAVVLDGETNNRMLPIRRLLRWWESGSIEIVPS